MKESAPERKPTRRAFLKGLGAAAAGIATYGIAHKLVEDNSVESKEHVKEGEASITKKEIINSKNLPLMPGHEHIPYSGVNFNYIHLTINGKETVVVVSDAVYDTYKVGDKVLVRYDDRNMKVEKILDSKKENN